VMMGHLEMTFLALLLWCEGAMMIVLLILLVFSLLFVQNVCVQVLLAPLLDSATWTTYLIL
jgi:hypothetical protein